MDSADNFKADGREILIIDDEILNLRLLGELLSREGFKVRSAERPGMAIKSKK
ncbi:hypothetical protein [Desulfobacula sp.]|jgi:CheY-like chemotaxis protein|uniref:hypothetical protein n=1 Tax=Desulfobacula sp. TaxID=2593537 RepID=UPI002608B8B4|nr:hypothetical protein [Desulfobacula sp.]